jgi:hypothetical protein
LNLPRQSQRNYIPICERSYRAYPQRIANALPDSEGVFLYLVALASTAEKLRQKSVPELSIWIKLRREPREFP